MFREPRGNRGRLRHCNGLQTPKATGRQTGKAGARFEARSQDTGLAVLVAVPITGPASPSKRRMRPVSRSVFEGVLNAFILRLAGVCRFFHLQPRFSDLSLVSRISSDSALVSQAITRFAVGRKRLKDQSNAKKLSFVSGID